MGAGLRPAVTLRYAGPTINVLAIVLTGRVLGPELGVALAARLVPAHPEVAVLVACAGLVASTAGRGGEAGAWFEQSWGYAKQIVPLLLAGVLVAGLLLGTPDREGWLPAAWVRDAVGGEGLRPNVFAALAGALMYFATLTEVPILQGLLESGMGRGPALALRLAGPAVSLPSLVVVHSIVGLRKTLAYAGLVVVCSAVAGWTFEAFPGPGAPP